MTTMSQILKIFNVNKVFHILLKQDNLGTYWYNIDI